MTEPYLLHNVSLGMTRLILLLALPAAFAQNGPALQDNRDPKLACGHLLRCEMRDQTVSATGHFTIQGLHNGEASIRGWSRSDVRVRVRVVTGGKLDQIHSRISPGRLSIDGPERSFFNWMSGTDWSADVEIFVPHGTGLAVETHNGQIFISDISGRVEARAHNGSMRLDRLAGDARVTLHNGTAILNLAGQSASTRRVEAESHNGDVSIGMPRGFSASVTTRVHNGDVRSEFTRAPNRGREDRDFEIGSGGMRVSARTHNGSIRLRQL